MITYPYGYKQTLTRSHQMASYNTLTRPGSNLPAQRLSLLSGQVSLDSTAAYRGQLSCQVVVPPGAEFLLPTSGETLSLAPYGNEITVWRGVVLPAAFQYSNGYFGSAFMVPLGVFRISEDSIDDSGEGGSNVVSLTAYDRSRSVSRAKFTSPWVIAAGTLYSDAITAVVMDRLPFLDPNYDLQVTPTGLTTPLLVFDTEEDPWAKVQEMAASIGMEAFFDGYGRFVLQLINQSDEETWLYTDGEDAIVTGISRRVSDEPGYNGVLVNSESTTLAAPIRSIAWDSDPDSPTYADGPYGKVPKIMTSPYVTTKQQGDDMALTELDKVLGITEQVSITVVPNVAHELGDSIRVKRATPAWDMNQSYTAAGATNTSAQETVDNGSLYTVESMTIGLQASDTMQINGKARVLR